MTSQVKKTNHSSKLKCQLYIVSVIVLEILTVNENNRHITPKKQKDKHY